MSDIQNSLVDQLFDYPYNRLNQLLGTIKPAKDPLITHIGEPQGTPPALLEETVLKNGHLWSKYPPIKGTAEFRQAATDWATKRYNLPAGFINSETDVIPVSGTREGLFQIGLFAADRKKAQLKAQLKDGEQPIICLPNPLYHVYFGAALMGHATPYMINATEENNFVPDFEAIPEEVLQKTALIYLCTPGNPVGTIATKEQLKTVLKLAQKYDFILAVDECYSELYKKEKPVGGLEAALELGQGLKNLFVFNSLSKRSSAPGLRSGIIIADPELLTSFNMLRGYGGAQTAGPLMAAATALWQEDTHVLANRNMYNHLIDIADDVLGDLDGYHSPQAAFFLWFNTQKHGLTGEEAALKIWKETGVKTMPGRYMCRPDKVTGKTPGDDYIRIALVHAPETVKEICIRVRNSLI